MDRRWVFGLGILVVIVGSVAITLAVYFFNQLDTAPKDSKMSRRHDVFAGFSLCEEAIRDSVGGRVMSLETDDRAAQYDRSNNMNMLYFVVEYQKSLGFLSSGFGKKVEMFVRCDVSAFDNEVQAIRLRPAEEATFTEIFQR